MKFTIVKSQFIEGLKAVQNIVAGKGSIQVMQNVLIDAMGKELCLTTTDLDISIRCKVECEVSESGKTTLPVKTLFSMVSKVSEGNVVVEVDAREHALIKCGSTRYTLNGLPEVEFPRLPIGNNLYEYKISNAVLKEMFRKVAYAASQDDTRRTLKGVLMSFKNGKLTMVATDGRRLAMIENELEFQKSAEKDIVVPSKAVQEIMRSLNGEGEVSIKVENSQVCFTIGEVNIYSKLMDEVYPNYTQVIPKECNQKISVDRQSLLDALDRASVMTLDEAHSTKLIFSEGKLLVTSAANDKGDAKDEVPIKYMGEKIEILFNPTYVMDPLKNIDEDEIRIDLIDGSHPAVIRCEAPFLYVIMPLRSN